MRTTLFAVAVVTVLAAGAPARATGGPPNGPGCVTVLDSDPTASPDTWTGVLYGAVAAPGSTVSLRCSLHLDNDSHTGPAAAAVSTAPSPSAATLVEPVSFVADADTYVALCTEATVDGTLWYRTPEGTWSTDPAVGCVLLDAAYAPPEPPCPVLDCLLCPVFATLPPGVPGVLEVRPDGDVYVAGVFFWDCPPYEGW